MKITHYLYNTFVIESDDKKIAIDPGGLFFYFFRFTTVIPKSEWKSITHIFVTHGDPDHYWHMDRVAKVSNAPVICNKTMVRNIGRNQRGQIESAGKSRQRVGGESPPHGNG